MCPQGDVLSSLKHYMRAGTRDGNLRPNIEVYLLTKEFPEKRRIINICHWSLYGLIAIYKLLNKSHRARQIHRI